MGKRSGKLDALTRRSGNLPKKGDQRLRHQSQGVLKVENLDGKLCLLSGALLNELAGGAKPIEELFDQGYDANPFPNEVLKMLRNNEPLSKKISLAECKHKQGHLMFREQFYVPNHDPLRLELMRLYHDAPVAGHPGRAKPFEILSRDYYWPKMHTYVERYIRNFHTCRRAKPVRHSSFGNLNPLLVPHQPWEEVPMDFVTGPQTSEGFDPILIVVDRLSKMRYLIPATRPPGPETWPACT